VCTIARWVRIVSSLLAALSTGCAIRLSGREHYLGPVLYRSTPPCRPDGDLAQTAHVGMLVEAGSQWGATIGLADRIVAAPVDAACTETWAALAPLRFGTTPEHWSLSLLYLRRTPLREPVFVRRRVVGARATVGTEMRSVSIGAVTTTAVTPPPDVLCALHFSERAPLRTRLRLWQTVPPGGEEEILKEVE
jgi:hypothetical protein